MSNSLLEVLIWELFYANVVHTYQLSPLILLVPIEPTSDQYNITFYPHLRRFVVYKHVLCYEYC
jgi:hypothetical protein